MNHIVIGTDEQDKAILANIDISIQEWLQHAYEDKARRCIDRICEIVSDKQVKKMTEEEKREIIKNIAVEPQTPDRHSKDLSMRLGK
jgi:hypothetical protein